MIKRLLILTCFVSLLFSSCQKSLKDIIAQTEKATFIIYTFDDFGTPNGSGSGFFIDEEGTGITCYHVLDGDVKAIIKRSDSVIFEIDTIILSDEKWDIVKFKVVNKNHIKFDYLKIANKAPEKGDKVYNISSPLGLVATVSEGIVSSLRKDHHGDIVQVTAPISPGSSGSALLNEKGEVFAVATFQGGGQNLNFGVAFTHQRMDQLESNDFRDYNPKFNQKDSFIILNIPSERSAEIVLNALEFRTDSTIAYFSYTNMNLPSGDEFYIWNELNKKDEGFLIHDLERNKKYYLTSSTIGVDKENATQVSLACSYRFKVFFPPIEEKPGKVDIISDYSSRGWQFKDIDLEKFRNQTNIDLNSYHRDHAFGEMEQGKVEDATSMFSHILDESPEDVQALNAMGIISSINDDDESAEYYFSQAIEYHPTNSMSYLNRYETRRNLKNYKEALDDINQVLTLDSVQPDNYAYRAILYIDMEEWDKAIADWNKTLSTEDFKNDMVAYYNRAFCQKSAGRYSLARKDIQTAYKSTTDPELKKDLRNLYVECGGGKLVKR